MASGDISSSLLSSQVSPHHPEKKVTSLLCFNSLSSCSFLWSESVPQTHVLTLNLLCNWIKRQGHQEAIRLWGFLPHEWDLGTCRNGIREFSPFLTFCFFCFSSFHPLGGCSHRCCLGSREQPSPDSSWSWASLSQDYKKQVSVVHELSSARRFVKTAQLD
jgi:hypothetical protein